MSRTAVILLVFLLIAGPYLPGAGIVSASEEAEAKEEWIQDEEKMDADDYQRFMEELRDMEESPGEEHEIPQEEQSYPDENKQDDEG